MVRNGIFRESGHARPVGVASARECHSRRGAFSPQRGGLQRHPSRLQRMNTKQEFVGGLGAAINEALGQCTDRGFVPPLHYVALAANGSMVAIRVAEERRELLTRHYELEGWLMPVTILVVDARADASLFIVQALGGPIERVY